MSDMNELRGRIDRIDRAMRSFLKSAWRSPDRWESINGSGDFPYTMRNGNERF